VKRNEARSRLISALADADGPLTIDELAAECAIARDATLLLIGELVRENMVVEGELRADRPGPHYGLGSRWIREAERRSAGDRIPSQRTSTRPRASIESEPVIAFHNYLISEYAPPRDKRFLVFFQCCVRRPYSASPSHGSMRRAVSVATGYDPSRDFERCSAHVVVLADHIGPVPYELEDVYPANVRAPSIKWLKPQYYEYVKPILAERVAEYVVAHRDRYDRIAAFCEGRYGEVMIEARGVAADRGAKEFPILPLLDGPRVIRMGKSIPRTYWQKYWIQLYLEIVSWLDSAGRDRAQARLAAMGVEHSAGDAEPMR